MSDPGKVDSASGGAQGDGGVPTPLVAGGKEDGKSSDRPPWIKKVLAHAATYGVAYGLSFTAIGFAISTTLKAGEMYHSLETRLRDVEKAEKDREVAEEKERSAREKLESRTRAVEEYLVPASDRVRDFGKYICTSSDPANQWITNQSTCSSKAIEIHYYPFVPVK